MIHNDIQNQLALLIKTTSPPLLEVADSTLETPEWTAGQQLPAVVIASLPNGRFQVQVEDQTLDMNLPPNTQPGDKLQLVFASGNPRPTFTLLSDLTRALAANQSSSVNLSDTSKLLTLLQANAAATANPANVANAGGNARTVNMQALVDTVPVLPGAPPAIEQFANALRDAISQSGLFYESHQAQWAVGERPLAVLLQEPQAQLSPILNPQKSPAAAPSSSDHNRPLAANTTAEVQASVPQPKTDTAQVVITGKGDESVLGMTNNNQSQIPVNNSIHPATVPLLQHQLDMLGTHQIIWQGQAWPGQEMEWEIEEDNRRAVDERQESTWRTRLHLNFPVLGGVTAHLALAGKGIKIDFSVEQSNSAQLLRGEAPSLSQAMESSGLQVTGLTVKQDGES